MSTSTNSVKERLMAMLQLMLLGVGVGLVFWAGFHRGSSSVVTWFKVAALGGICAVGIALSWAGIVLLRSVLVMSWNRFAMRKHSAEDLFVAALTDEKLSKKQADTLLRMSIEKQKKELASAPKPN